MHAFPAPTHIIERPNRPFPERRPLMEHPRLIVQEFFRTPTPDDRRRALEQLAEAWLRAAAQQVRP